MYNSDDLKSLGKFLQLTAKEALRQEPPNEDDSQTLMELYRQIEAIGYNPLLFESLLEEYEVSYSLMEVPIEDVPRHINDAGIISKTLVEWRCTNYT